MSLAGFKKQINKANQYVSEKIGGAKGTELDHDFHEMERKIDVTGKLVEELMARTHELLQPNPASRAKLSAVNTVSKFRGQAKNALYPQPEGQLGECMVKYGKELGEESALGPCLIESGEAFRQMADIKYALEDNVKQNFIEPLHHLQSQDLKQVNHHRKKMSGRRLDYDCKKRKQTKAGGSNISDDDIHMAEEKFEESKNLAEVAMFNLLENDVEQMSQLLSFSEAYMNYHRQATDIMTALHETLQEKVEAAAQRPKREHVPMRATSSSSHLDKSPMYDNSTGNHNAFGTMDNSGYNLSPAAPQYTNTNNTTGGGQSPCCRALYDFEPENDGELGFKEGDLITLDRKIDENWYEGTINGQSGFFPVNYVQVEVDLPNGGY